MFKKMLKGVLAIGAALAIAIPAHAETTGMVTADFYTDENGNMAVSHWTQLGTMMKGEKTSANLTWAYTGGTLMMWEYGVSWNLAETVTMKLGKKNVYNSWGYISTGAGSVSVANTPSRTYWGPIVNYVAAEGLHFDVKVGDAMVEAGILADGTKNMTPYGFYTGAFGDLGFTAGMVMTKDKPGTLISVRYNLGMMELDADIHAGKDSSLNATSATGIGFKNLELGPGKLGLRILTTNDAIGKTVTNLAYSMEVEPGTVFDVFMHSTAPKTGTTTSQTGISLSKFF